MHSFAGQVLDETGDDLDLAPALYTKRRLADVHALQNLEYMEVSGCECVDFLD